MKRIHAHLFIAFCLSVMLIGGAILTYFSYFDGTIINPVVEIENPLALEPVKEVYKRGELVQFYISYCKFRPIRPVVQWTLVDTYMRFYPADYRGSEETGCKKRIATDLEPVARDATAGSYYFYGELRYEVSSMRTVIVPLKTKTFRVE